MKLTNQQEKMLDGQAGPATQKAMQILVALGNIYEAEELISVTSVQIAGVSYANLGEAGLQFLAAMAAGGGQSKALTTLNPAGMDIENWQTLGIDPEFAEKQTLVIEAFAAMGILTTCTCTPYLSGNLPHFGEHIAWAESSAVCFANSVIGARSNREGGPSALAASLTGVTPAYGFHLDENRKPAITIQIETPPQGSYQFGALGKVIGQTIEATGEKPIPYIIGIPHATLEELKSFCASIGTYGGTALFHMHGITPEAAAHTPPKETLVINAQMMTDSLDSMNDSSSEEIDFVSLGCPHLSIKEIQQIAEQLDGQTVTKEFWITTARPTKQIADRMGYSAVIEASGAKFAVDTCCVVAPIKGRFTVLATDSAKACYYAYAKNNFKTVFKSFDEIIQEALK